jgi:hypothetical protein
VPTTTIRFDAVQRCRNAYRMNNIPWDDALAGMSDRKLIETARYWEGRADQVKAEQLLTSTAPDEPVRDIADGLSKMAGFPKNPCSTGGLTRRQRPRHGVRVDPKGTGGVCKLLNGMCGDGGMLS